MYLFCTQIGDVLVMLGVIAIFSFNILFYWRLHYIGDCLHPHTIIIQITMESNTMQSRSIFCMHYFDSYSGALELQSWRLPIQIKPDYAHSDPIPFRCLEPHSSGV
eukprot:172251_1